MHEGGGRWVGSNKVVELKKKNEKEFKAKYQPPRASQVAQLVKNLPAMQKTPVRFLGQEDPLEKG